jgi:hypothetical protein
MTHDKERVHDKVRKKHTTKNQHMPKLKKHLATNKHNKHDIIHMANIPADIVTTDVALAANANRIVNYILCNVTGRRGQVV